MNRTVVTVLTILAVLGTAFAGVCAGAEVRKSILVSQCEETGRVGLFRASSGTDPRPDGFLPFYCVDRSTY